MTVWKPLWRAVAGPQSLPLALGFGLRTGADLRRLHGLADMGILGTALLTTWEQGGAAQYEQLLQDLRAATVRLRPDALSMAYAAGTDSDMTSCHINGQYVAMLEVAVVFLLLQTRGPIAPQSPSSLSSSGTIIEMYPYQTCDCSTSRWGILHGERTSPWPHSVFSFL